MAGDLGTSDVRFMWSGSGEWDSTSLRFSSSRSLFPGNWELDMPNGNGVLEKADGYKYKGDWLRGKVLLTSKTRSALSLPFFVNWMAAISVSLAFRPRSCASMVNAMVVG